MMAKPVLVTYATRTGSTAGVAEFIGKVLVAEGLAAQVRPMDEVSSLAEYGSVVAGSAIQDKRWLPEAIRFLEMYRTELAERRCAVFLVCMTLAMGSGEKYMDTVSGFLQPVRALVTPVSEGVFAGALDIRKIPYRQARLGFRLSVMAGVWSEGDHRDWELIGAWARSLVPLLGPGPV